MPLDLQRYIDDSTILMLLILIRKFLALEWVRV